VIGRLFVRGNQVVIGLYVLMLQILPERYAYSEISGTSILI
jgi:hypothetical protein